MSQGAFRDLVLGRRSGLGPLVLRWALRILSLPYSLGMGIRNRAYDLGWIRSQRAGVPVVSVGNLTVGGTGKTPVVEMIARWYKQNGVRVAILSRGYGARGGPNDEARLLEENLPDVPHLQGRGRVWLAQRAIDEFQSELVLLDDGMQHRQLARDLEIVLIDASCPFGGGWALPGGLLREPPSALRRADLIAITRADLADFDERRQIVQQIRRHSSRAPIVEVEFRPDGLHGENGAVLDAARLNARRVLAFCGIGNPDSFRIVLESLGADLIDLMIFPDHHAYSPSELVELREWGRRTGADCLVTTQKDWVKVAVLGETGATRQPPLFFLRIRAVVTVGEADFYNALRGVHPRAARLVSPEIPIGGDSP